MTIRDLKEYSVIQEKEISDLNSKGYLIKHKKSGAKILILSNDDENKVFTIGFRTPPKDSTGTPHILEHSVLCGSKNFPIKDPFVELVKGSLNTFLNAMTYPDKTVYPVASCNDKDFQNLMHVYMDAVLYPNIYKKEEIFKQEGWHYALEDKDSDLEITGVVYNEMKGVFSSPEGILDREIVNSLFPDTAYGYESGGDPEVVPELSYQEFLDFHSKYYHPSNSYIYLYGDMDIFEKLIWMDREYLCKYDNKEINSEIKFQKPFENMKVTSKKYSISSTESEKENTYLSYNKVIGTSLDKELYLAFQILEYALILAPGAPLKKRLLDEKIGKDIMGSYDNGVCQPVFSIIAKNSETDKKDKFIEIIEEVLREQVKNGVNEKSLAAGINLYEFKYREADFGNYPKGLMYGLQSFDSWLYDDEKPFMHLEQGETFKLLKTKIGTGYFENLIDKYLLNNEHCSIVMIEPQKGLTAKMDSELKEKLSVYKASLSETEIEKLVKDTAALKKYQDEPSTKEELESIPLLKREDIKKEAAPFINEELIIDNTKVLWHNMFTNKIAYLNLIFDADNISQELIPYVSILKHVLGYIDTKNYEYGELVSEINANTGGINNTLNIYADLKEQDKFTMKFEIKARFLYEKLGFAFDMIKEIICNSKLDDEKRLCEIIAEMKSRMQMVMNSAGHSISAVRAMSYFSKTALLNDMISGIEFYKVIDNIESNFETEKVKLIENLKKTVKYIFRPENLLISFTSDEEGFEPLKKDISDFKNVLFKDDIKKDKFELVCVQKDEGFMAASKVQYVSRAGNFIDAGYKYTGALRILKVVLSYDYLWINIRVKGGAYGCMSGFSRKGDSYMSTYRDPNLEKSNEVFENTPDYLKSFNANERDMTKYIIGTISDLDTPLNPYAKGERSLTAYLTNLDYETIQKERDEVLNASAKDIRDLEDTVKAILKPGNICVIGNEEKLQEQKQMFKEVSNLY